ncbi:Holliday junction branch migration protein RuvA [Spectribacter hydrogenoxidans]|uniref:Holliday junction branch migration complex subunit RuvA n=1 Tax=Spectribacter hydrogenoxidans TaxID=3075608 RepID=A0ABU3C268_9GAMM|nr:Holliday junction branch migration protein RuvA [Salinisphaera sp. W335]MDT0635653.1 Holliday junction branch migration protein RuvA [Salinisphaera sp. W335]
MIGRLEGRLLEKRPPWLVLDVGGVGYEVEAPMSTFYKLPAVGESVVLRTHLVVREDAFSLFGFGAEAERSLFRDLIKVSGVGPRLALTILSGISPEDFVATIQEGDADRLTGLPGVGKKTAARLMVDMRDRLGGVSASGLTMAGPAGGGVPDDPAAEAHHALTSLGYKPAEATRLLRNCDTAGQSSEELIRQALKRAVR